MAHALLLCKWGAATPPCCQSMLCATAQLLSAALHVSADRAPEETHHSLPPAWQQITPLTKPFQFSAIRLWFLQRNWTENANGHSTKAMWHGLTWSWMPFSATSQIWSSVGIRVGRIRMLPLIWSQCPRSPEPPSHTSICALNVVQAWEQSPASEEGTWKGNTIRQTW